MIPENAKQNSDKQRTLFIVVSWCLCVPWHWCLLVLVRTEKAPLSFLGTQCLRWAPRKHHHLKKQKWGECNSTTILIVAFWCPVLGQALRRHLGARPLQCKRGCACPVLPTKGHAGVKQMKQGGNWIFYFLFFTIACILIRQKPARPSPEACRPLAMQKRGSIPSFSCLWRVLTAVPQQDSNLLERQFLFFVSECPCLPRTR